MSHDDSSAIDSEIGVRAASDRASAAGGLSLLIPGLGQLVQGRRTAAAWHFGTVVFYLVAATGLTSAGITGRNALLVAVLWNVWSAVDAWRHGRSTT